MNRNHGNAHFETVFLDNKTEGYAGLELYRTSKGKKERVARVLFWDASGQFFLETFNTELPVDIVEKLILETKTAVKIR